MKSNKIVLIVSIVLLICSGVILYSSYVSLDKATKMMEQNKKDLDNLTKFLKENNQ